MRQKRIACILGIALLSAAALPVYAQETSQEKTTQLEAEVGSEYTLTIPAKTTIAFNATETDLTGTLKVSGNVLPTQNVTVTATCNPLHNAVQNTNLPYTLKIKDGDTFSSAQWNEDELRSGQTGDGKQIALSVAITEDEWKKAEAGKYEGSIVFSAELKSE